MSHFCIFFTVLWIGYFFLKESDSFSALTTAWFRLYIIPVTSGKIFAFLSGLAEPVGALIGLLAVEAFVGLTPWLLSFAAGLSEIK